MNKLNKKIIFIFAIITLLFLYAKIPNINAGGFDDGGGNDPTVRGPGVWWEASDSNYNPSSGVPSQAWNDFYAKQRLTSPPRYSSDEKLRNAVNKAGGEFGNELTLWDSCKKSKYIFWYGSNKRWTDSNNGLNYHPGTLYTQVSNSNSSTIKWVNLSPNGANMMELYKSQSKYWTGGKVILICSYTFDKEEELTLFFKANSKSVQYDNKPHTVDGLHPDTDISQLKAGHKYSAVAERTETRVGDYPVTFKPIVITDQNGKNVTDEYIIKTENGLLNIYDVPTIKDPPEDNERVEYRCLQTFNMRDSESAVTRKSTYGNHGFTASNAPFLPATGASKHTAAGDFALKRSEWPKRDDVLSVWTRWKKTFKQGDDTSKTTPTIDLEDAGVSAIMSKYGGVYNISRRIETTTFYVEWCQPQMRYIRTSRDYGFYPYIEDIEDLMDEIDDWYYYEEIENINLEMYVYGLGWIEDVEILRTRWAREPEDDEVLIRYNDGWRYYSEWVYVEDIREWDLTVEYWSEWKDDGEEEITDFYRRIDNDDNSYQLLSVNCNKSGFNSIYSSHGERKIIIGSGDATGALKTRERPGLNTGPLGYGTTGSNAFYMSNSSCDVYSCTAVPLLSSDADNKNNKNNREFFQEEYVDGRPGYGELRDGEKNLYFFRDNEDNIIRADLWYTKNINYPDLFAFPEQEATGTLAKLYPGGTPEIQLTTIRPISEYRKMTYFGEEKSWDGPLNKFVVKSQWASYEGKPYRIGLMWMYMGQANNKQAKVVDGYKVINETGIYSYFYDVACPFKNYETGHNPGYIPKTPFVNPYVDTSGLWSNLESLGHSIKAIFVRSVSE